MAKGWNMMIQLDDNNLDKSTPNQTDNRRPREHASSDVGEVGEAEDDQRLDHANILGEGGDEADQETMHEAYQRPAKHHSEEWQCCHDDLYHAHPVHLQQGDHGVVEDHRDTIVEQRLAKHEEVQSNIDVDLLKSEDNILNNWLQNILHTLPTLPLDPQRWSDWRRWDIL